MKTEHDKAVALAEKYAEYNWDEHYLETVTAMLADHKQQVRDEYREELAQRSRVMPDVMQSAFEGGPICWADEVREAIASLEARLHRATLGWDASRLLMEQSEARMKELEREAEDWKQRYMSSVNDISATGIDKDGYQRW